MCILTPSFICVRMPIHGLHVQEKKNRGAIHLSALPFWFTGHPVSGPLAASLYVILQLLIPNDSLESSPPPAITLRDLWSGKALRSSTGLDPISVQQEDTPVLIRYVQIPEGDARSW